MKPAGAVGTVIPRTVGGPRYRDGMSNEGLTRLVVSLMVAGRVAAVDAAQPADAHAAVLRTVRLPGGELLPTFFGTEVRAVPDPSVGLRVVGLTRALWGAVGQGWLRPYGYEGLALLMLSAAAARDLEAEMSRLTDAQAHAVRQAGEVWAASSTSLKNLASAFASPVSA
jgi:hypothetical protein